MRTDLSLLIMGRGYFSALRATGIWEGMIFSGPICRKITCGVNLKILVIRLIHLMTMYSLCLQKMAIQVISPGIKNLMVQGERIFTGSPLNKNMTVHRPQDMEKLLNLF